ncbi:TlpA family protein disulfide reductase [Fodinibius halophilus]|uniref:TlpA family protein disulfide reductase n=1 Tax=Fodinibius halophilus TaxID=1736908 RepID=A0A6M1T554_9BACT|nr:TlpA disulfide reductase family protein [Fodinibius halophilus]NGP88385.1 TlpA family protein disulfide reductase [Fodinibius halophilus]
MDKRYLLQLIFVTLLILTACDSPKKANISGTIDYVGSADIYISKQPVHYKYAPKKHFPVNVTEEGSFTLSLPIDSTQLVKFNINEQTYPVVVQPGQSLTLDITFSEFPDSVTVRGYPKPWDQKYMSYRTEVRPIQQKIETIIPDFREGKKTNITDLYKRRYKITEAHFDNTPLIELYYKAVGEYLVKQLEEIKYQRTTSDVSPERRRQKVLEEAKALNFFSFKSLHSQRAGIRDFTNAFANTFGVEDSLEKKFGQELMQYDIKRLGYQTLDSARTAVLQYIDQRKARAYAKMYLVAERIGEMSLEVATPSYKDYLKEYSDFPKYTSFLKTFYQQIKRVSPGQPAVPFTLPNENEQMVSMKDYKGQYVLLDFWASWCIPCLDEFPHMKELYNKYSRDQFEILAISIEEDSLRWRQAIQRFDNPWPQLYGGKGFQQETFRSYRGGGIPFYILVGPDGNILRYNDARPSFNLPTLLDSLITDQK